MTSISSETVKNLYYVNVIFELHQTKDKIILFEKKYNKDFSTFEKEIREVQFENFEMWDDYIEWKGFQHSYRLLLNQKKDIENGNIKIT